MAAPIKRKSKVAVAIRYDVLDLFIHAVPIRALDGSFTLTVKHMIHDGLVLELAHRELGPIHYKLELRELLHYDRDAEAYADAHRLCASRSRTNGQTG